MGNPLSELTELLSLAGERSSERRRELLRRLTDTFIAAPEAFDPRQTAELSAILSALAREMDVEVRRTLAGKIAKLPEAPRGITLELANDEIQVATPILKDSLVLTDADLSALAKIVSQEHLEAIARRARISSAVGDSLAHRGNDAVLTELARNKGADLSREALEIMISRAESSKALHEPLVLHPRIPADLLNGLFFIVSTALRRVIVDRTNDLDPKVIDDAIRESETRLRARSASAPDTDLDDLVAAVQRSGPLTEGLLCTLARQRDDNHLAAVFAKLSALSLATARRILGDPDPVGLAVVCRACRFDLQTFLTLAAERAAAAERKPDATVLMAIYQKTPVEAARRVVRFWRIRQALPLAA
jgi:uncharacterized protein (DUF2336 family)